LSVKLVPGTTAFIFFLAALTTLGPLATDMYLPSLPAIQAAFATDTSAVQATLSIFLIGTAGSQLIYGPLSDRVGRRPALLVGLGFYVFSSLACMLAQSIEQLMLARFLQALGGGCSMVLARAIVRDVYSGEAAAQMLARMAVIMGLVPALAPLLGGIVQKSFGWESNFIFMSAGGLAIALLTYLKFPETLPAERRQTARSSGVASQYKRLILDSRFRRYLLIGSFSFAGMFAYISGASFVLQNNYALSPVQFGLCFGTMVLGFIAGSFASARMGGRYGIERMLLIGTSLIFAGGLLLVAAYLVSDKSVLAIILPITIYATGVGITFPQSMAGALTPFPEIAGTASALMGFLQAAFAALVGLGVGHILNYGAWPMIATIALMGAFTFLTTLSKHPRLRRTP
jgi:DHA1 family bicyclomycin/chloramphenicol resistance-like MFS transporter